MLSGLRSRVAALVGRSRRGGEEDDTGESSESTGFVRSRLDASVLFAHGKRGTVDTTDDDTVQQL
jgi:hypothetical protein